MANPEVEARCPVWFLQSLTHPSFLLNVILACSAETSTRGIFRWVLLLISFFLTNRWKLTARFLRWHKERFCHAKWGRKNNTQNKEFSIRNCTIATEKDVEAHYSFSACCNLCFDATGHQKSEDLFFRFSFPHLLFGQRSDCFNWCCLIIMNLLQNCVTFPHPSPKSVPEPVFRHVLSCYSWGG